MKQAICTIILCAICYLGLHNGYLAIYQNEEKNPLMVFPYHSEIYPEKDQTALKHGIPYHSKEELAKLLEDFLS